jgi:hypothetical protein
MSRRDLRDALVILGRETVMDAIANRQTAKAYWLDNAREFQDAVKALRGLLRNRPAATAFVDTLSAEMRRSLAAAWIGDVGPDIIAEMGLQADGES